MNIDSPSSLSNTPGDYPSWLSDLKTRIRRAQQCAAFAANRELEYWGVISWRGRNIRQQQAEWATKRELGEYL